MTLVAIFEIEERIYIVGDAMASTIRWANSDISYPTQPSGYSDPTRAVRDLIQKVVEIGPDVFLAYATNNTTDIIPLIEVLKQDVSLGKSSTGDLENFFNDYVALHKQRLLMSDSQVALVVGHPASVICSSCLSLQIGDWKVTLLGSGRKYVHDFLMDSSKKTSLGGWGFNCPDDITKITKMLELMLEAMTLQQMTGVGLDQGWGGAFEIILAKGDGNLEKVDRILFHGYRWREDFSNHIYLKQLGRRYVQFYDKDKLVILSQGESESLRQHLSVSPVEVGRVFWEEIPLHTIYI